MKTTAIICEYNPLHKGHKLQLDMVKDKGNLALCIMSGSFVQRGTPAVFDKYARAEAAVKAGADLVLELPYPYSCAAAEFFALGGVSIAHNLKIVDELLFGSECGNVSALNTVSERLLSSEFDENFKKMRSDKSNKEKPYAYLRSEVYQKLYGQNIPLRPNDILGVEYINALKKLKSPVIPITYRREEGYSATQSRELLKLDNFDMIPDEAVNIFGNSIRYDARFAERAILAYYRNADPRILKEYAEMTNGIADKLVKCAKNSTSLTELTDSLAGKSYTNAKIRRCIIHGLLQTSPSVLSAPPAFTRVLGCNDNGRALLKKIQKVGNINLITKPAHGKRLTGVAREQFELSAKADGLLTLMCEQILISDIFMTKNPYVDEYKD